MNIFRKVVMTRCSGKLDPECENFKNKAKLRPGLLHCPKCGSRIVEDKALNKPVVAAVAVVFAAVLGFGAYRVYRAVASVYGEVEYARHITQAALSELKSVPELKGLKVQVGFKNGVLTLTGQVSNEAQKEAADAVARKVNGVKQVVNHLALVAKPPVLNAPPPATPPTPETARAGGTNATTHKPARREASKPVVKHAVAHRERRPTQARPVSTSGRTAGSNLGVSFGNSPSEATSSSQQNGGQSSQQVEQMNGQQEQLEATIAKQRQQQQEMKAHQAQLEAQQRQLQGEVERLREKAKTQPEPPKPTPPAYNGPSSGNLIWQGQVEGTQLVEISNGHSPQGIVTGNLPGVPCMVQPTDTKHVSVAIGPMPKSGWKRIVIRVKGKGFVVVKLTWTIL